MKDYFQKDLQIELLIEKHAELLNERYGGAISVSNSIHDLRLLFNQRKPEHIQLTIYSQPSDHLVEKLQLLKEENINILELIKPKPAEHKWDFPDILDFSNSNLINIEESHYWEHNRRPVILTIDNLNILIESRINGDGGFQLTENIFQHLEKYIQYGELSKYSSNEAFIYKDKNRNTNFGPITFKLSFEHWFGTFGKHSFEITRDAYLNISDNSNQLTDSDILKQSEFLCILMSLYWQKPIDFFHAQIRRNNEDKYRTCEIFKYSNHFVDESEHYLLESRFKTFYDFIEALNYKQVITNSEFLKELVPRLLKIKNIDGISSFMILYNIIEKIRNYCMISPFKGSQLEIKEEYNFTESKSATDKYIKNKIKEIKEIVKKHETEEFEKNAHKKVSFIKKTGLIDQFESILLHLELDPSDYNIDFTVLIKTRNNIYHGKLPNTDIQPYVEQMTLMVYDMILKLIA